MNKNTKILITGGSGFIGTNCVKKFMDSFQVLNVDINVPKDKAQTQFWYKCDITDYKQLKTICNDYQPNYIIHLAARTDLNGNSIDDYKANTVGVDNILKISMEISSLRKIIITSSMLVCKPGYIPKSQNDYAPTTVYGESKIETEKITWSYLPKLECDWCIIRPSSIWGEYFGVPYRNFFDMILSKKYFHVGHKGCSKTYGYVGNAVYQIEKLLFCDTKNLDNKVFYIGDYVPTNIEEWANEISMEIFGKKIIRMPYFIIKCAAFFGDFLKLFGFHFPMTSFRLHNMTTDNIVPLDNTRQIAPDLPYERVEAVHRTLQWMQNS